MALGDQTGRFPSPLTVDAERKEVVQEIVVGRDIVEHLDDRGDAHDRPSFSMICSGAMLFMQA